LKFWDIGEMFMKILVVCQHYKPEPFRIADLCESLVKDGHEVTVVTGVPNYPEGKIYAGYEKKQNRNETLNGVKIHRCFTIPRKSGVFFRVLNYYSFSLSSQHYLSRFEEDFDVVFVYQLSPVMMASGALKYAKKHRKKVVLYCLDLWPESLIAGGIRKNSLIYKIFLHKSRRIYSRADTLLMASQSFESYFRETLKISDHNLQYLPQYAENVFDKIPMHSTHEPPYNFLFAGNIGGMQSVETIVEAARMLSSNEKIKIHVVGSGSEYSRCKALAEGLPNITFYGRQDIEKMPSFYTMADAGLVTMKADPVISLTIPGKVQSYMAAGLPVIGAIDGETVTVVNKANCGICVPSGDAAGLADTMRRLADNPESLVEYGRNARLYYQKTFRKQIFMEHLLKVLTACANSE
jgi:glycosyltransferase involved in cell wall biosynthesis